MEDVIAVNLLQFSLIYLLLIIVLAIMKKSKVDKSKLVVWASFRMTLQLVICGYVLAYIFENPNWLFTLGYLIIMVVFAGSQIVSKNKWLNKKFKLIIFATLGVSAFSVLSYFLLAVLNISVFNPRYAITIGGMIIGNSMTGVSLALRTYKKNIVDGRNMINSLSAIGATPKAILLPIINESLSTAILPTLNSMLTMGIISLPGMMTGQILSGTLPTTAILYQIAIMIAICTCVCLTVFAVLNLGSVTLYDKDEVIQIME